MTEAMQDTSPSYTIVIRACNDETLPEMEDLEWAY